MKCATLIGSVVMLLVMSGSAISMEYERVDLDIATSKDTFKISEKINLAVTLKNNLHGSISFMKSRPDADYIVDVVDEHGKALPPKNNDAGQIVVNTLNFVYRLPENQSLQENVNVTDLFDFKHPGEYGIRVSRVIFNPHEEGKDHEEDNHHRRIVPKDVIIESNRLRICISD